MLPPKKLASLIAKYMDVKTLRPEGGGESRTRSLLDDVKAFDVASRDGRYYESFNVNSLNFMEKSAGTLSFIEDCHRLFDRCVAEGKPGDATDVRAAFELLFALLRYLDEGNDDMGSAPWRRRLSRRIGVIWWR